MGPRHLIPALPLMIPPLLWIVRWNRYWAVAMTATFYGIFGANFLFLPIAGKLQAYSEQELFLKEVMIEGVLSIQNKEVPAILARRLQAYLNETSQSSVKMARQDIKDQVT